MDARQPYQVHLPNSLSEWLIGQGGGNLESGISRVAFASGYRPPQESAAAWTVKRAVAEAGRLGYRLDPCTVGAALRAGNIRGATQPSRDWMLDPAGFLEWLQYKYNPRKRKA